MSPTWETAADWDSAQSETGMHSEQPTGTDWAANTSLEKGWAGSDWSGWSIDTPEFHLPLNEDSGTTANDVSGNGNDFSITSATIGNAGGPWGHTYYSFDGTDDLLEGTYDIGALSGASVAVWFRTNNTADGGGDENLGIVSWGEDGAFGEIPIVQTTEIQNGFNGRQHFGVRATDGNDIHGVDADQNIDDNNWHLGVVTFDDTNGEIIVDLDGGTATDSDSSWGGWGPVSSTVNVANYIRTSNKFQGDIGPIAVFPEILSSSQINDLYQAAL